MEAQVLKSLAKLRKACTRSHKELRDVIDAAQANLTAAVKRREAGETNASTGVGGLGTNATEVPFEPFLLACLTRHAKLVALSLDCIEKFLAFGFLKGNGSIPEGIRKRLVQKSGAKKPQSSLSSLVGYSLNTTSGASANGTAAAGGAGGGRSSIAGGGGGDSTSDADGGAGSSLNEENWKLIDCIIEVICDCQDHPDETVQIQVLRVLLTAVTTTTCEVHEHSLLKAVRSCYHIQLVSKSSTNQTVAKATLQQIISIVFQRMETFDQRVQEETEATLKESLQKSETQTVTTEITDTSSESADTSQHILASPTASLYPQVIQVLHLLPQSAVTSTTQTPHGSNGKLYIAPVQSPSGSGGNTPIFAPSFPSVLHKDAFLLFRSLCRISMRSVAEDSALGSSGSGGALNSGSMGNSGGSGGIGATDDPFAFQSKILSLELVLSIINNAGPSFRKGERFVHAIRQYLCQSLLQNCTSNYTQIVGLSLQVFLVLMNNFKRHLKAEIDIFVTSIFLRILQSENSSFEHKMLVLEVLNNICDDASILGEIFLNYDCDWNTNDLFKQIIDALAKIAKGKKDSATLYANMSSSVRLKMQQNDAALVLKGLECLTATVASLKKAANFVEIEKKASVAQASGGGGDADDDNLAPPAISPTASLSTPSLGMSAVEAFDRKKKRQEELATGILKFNVKPSAGIQYLVQHGHLGQGTPRDVARFIHEHNDKLDKTMVGDYLGKEQQYQSGFCVKVLHEFVDMMDFSGMEIDVAIRHFLSGFRLPGESQKIDRMMEKFAERYYSSCPPGLFPSADTAFILSFSIIMLQTDLHNPSIPEEKKMDKAGFLRNNRGINNGEDLPEEYMGGIFDRIKQNPISLKEDEDFKARRKGGAGVKAVAASTIFGASIAAADRQRRDAYIKERETMVRQSEALFKRRNPGAMGASSRNVASSPRSAAAAFQTGDYSSMNGIQLSSQSNQFHLVTELTEMSHVRPMFETVWAPLLACCSVIFESSDSPVAIQLCLNSFKHAIHLSARLNMPSERDAFVTVLAKFTALHNTGSRLMRSKNIEAIKALISISVKEGNYLGDSWRDILQCISQLARVQTHAQGLHSDMQFFHHQPSPAGSSTGSTGSFSSTPTNTHSNTASKRNFASSSAFPSPSHRDTSGTGMGSMGGEDMYNPAIEDENAARVMAEIDSLASDRVFSSSVSLSDNAIQEFVLQLCVVSLTECSGVSNGRLMQSNRHDNQFSLPRVFSLQKLVEVADMNMNMRSRMVWASTWKTLSRHFTTIGCHDNLSIAMYAIDSLRQLSMKFLEREELKDFNFQRLFLTPFEVIMANAISMEIRELVLRCVENMILARVNNIKSGWKTIWGVLRVAAETYEPGNEDHQDKIVRLGFQIAKRIFENHFDRIVEVFVDAVECLLAFAVCGSEEVEKNMEEHMGLTQLSIESIGILQHVCMLKLATGQVIEKLFVEGSASKRVGFKTKKKTDGAAVIKSSGSIDENDPTGVVSPSSRSSLRYEKQESSRTLVEEIEMLSPPNSPKRRSSILASTTATVGDESTAVYNDSSAHTRMWWPVLTALSTLAADRRIDVRLAALHALYDSLEAHGSKFSTGLWSLVFKGVLIPLLDELRHLEVFVEKGRRLMPKLPPPATSPSNIQYTPGKSTSTFCLERLLECFGLFYDVVGFLPEVLFLLGKCMDTTDTEEELAAASATSLEKMLVAHGHKFPDDVWGLIADELRSVMKRAEPTWIFFISTQPIQAIPPPTPASPSVTSPSGAALGLMSPRLPSLISMYPSVMKSLEFTFTSSFPPKVVTEEEVLAQQVPSRTHLSVILALQKVMGSVLSSRFTRNLALSEGHVGSLTNCLRESYLFARKVNDAIELRQHLAQARWTYGKINNDDLPSLLQQEVEGKVQYLNVLFHLIRELGPSEERKREDARRHMSQLVKQTIEEYLTWTVGDPTMFTYHAKLPIDARQRTVRYEPLLVGLLAQIAQCDGTEIKRHLPWLYSLLNELIKTPSGEVRAALAFDAAGVTESDVTRMPKFDLLSPIRQSSLSSAEIENADTLPMTPNATGGSNYRSTKTPRHRLTVPDFEGGALRSGGAPKLLSQECLGLFAQYAVVGLLYGALPGTIYPFLQNYLNVQGTQAVAARTLVSIPWSFKVFYGMLTDCFPLFGYRRRPYMVLGWTICLSMLIVMACTPIGAPYYADPSVRDVKPEDYTDEQRASLNMAAPDEGGKYVVLMMFASVGYLMSDVAADAVVVEFAQREPEATRGRTQTAIYTVRTVAMMVANILLAFLFNGEDYGGEYDFTLSFPQLMLVLAIVSIPIIPITMWTIIEEPYTSPGFKTYISDFWGCLQMRAIYQVIAYKFFSGFFENFTFVAMDPMQTYWANVSPRNEKICNIFILLVMAGTLIFTGQYGLNWNWRIMAVVTMLGVVVLDAICMFFVTWNIWRNQYFWLGIPVIEQLPQGVGFIVATYVVVELAEMGHEGAIYGLLTTVNNLSDPFAKTISKNVDTPFDIYNEAIQNDTDQIRRDISFTLVIMYTMKLLSLVWLPLLPRQKKETQLLKAYGGTSKTMGAITVAYVTFAMVWSVMTNLMTMFPATSCLMIAGGDGC